MFGNIVPLTTVGNAQVLPGTVLPTNTVGNNDLVIIQDTTTATSQAELINQLQNHITENQQILIITDDQGQDQCKFYFIFIILKFILILFQMLLLIKIKILMLFYKMVRIYQFKNDDYFKKERIDDILHE
jgi:hypothetical protein